jgi:hypothetical protein
MTDDGVELPVMDVTHPAFAESINPEKADALVKDFLEFQKSPAFFRRLFSRNSIAMRGLDSASNKFLGGMTTYIAKLGPGILGRGYSGWVDRKVAGGIGSVAFRIRLQETARLIAEALEPQLAPRKNCPLHLLNLGGGPAMDSLNALILLHKDRPECLADRRISIHVLDLDRAGPSFGARAAAALCSEGAPLHGLQLAFEYVPYDWNHVSNLRKILGPLETECIVIGSSEGGLFEYGSDESIVGNLRELGKVGFPGFVLIGSLFREGTIQRWLQTANRIPIRMFERTDFEKLVTGAGWSLLRVLEDNPIYRVVSLGAVEKITSV